VLAPAATTAAARLDGPINVGTVASGGFGDGEDRGDGSCVGCEQLVALEHGFGHGDSADTAQGNNSAPATTTVGAALGSVDHEDRFA